MRKLVYLLLATVALAACSTIDCPLANSVYTRYKLQGGVSRLADTLTVSTQRHTSGDTILLNRAVGVDSFQLPMSYTGNEEVLYFTMKDTLNTTHYDTITIEKDNQPHFESVDCSPSFFHNIHRIRHTGHRIDSIVINNTKVTNDNSKAHFFIYFKSGV